MNKIQSDTDILVEAILSRPGSMNEKLGLMILTATQFVGAGANLLERISKEKGGPDMDLSGWAEEITKMIVDECKKQLRH